MVERGTAAGRFSISIRPGGDFKKSTPIKKITYGDYL
jgi:hypothetical protein